jgi:Type I restriction enzyme R protein N terminus (HSDR_N)
MLKIPRKVLDRFAESLKKYQSVATSHKSRDVSEADTVTLVKDILADVFGYDKYTELTSEYQIRGTYCDLAVQIGGDIKYLVEVKAAGVELNEGHLRQVLQYGASKGVAWIVLTNAIDWRLYKIKFGQPIEHDEVSSFSLLSINLKNEDDLRRMFLLSYEGSTSDAMKVFHDHTQLLNKYTVSQVLVMDSVVAIVRRELRRLFPDLKVDIEQITDLMNNEILKREVIDGDKPREAQQRVKKALQKLARQNAKKESGTTEDIVQVDTSEAIEVDASTLEVVAN